MEAIAGELSRMQAHLEQLEAEDLTIRKSLNDL